MSSSPITDASVPDPSATILGSDTAIILLAAGSGRRMGHRKQYLKLVRRPLIHWCLDAFSEALPGSPIVIVHARDDSQTLSHQVGEWLDPRTDHKHIETVVGGSERYHSSHQGILKAQSFGCKYVLIHDVARPLIHPEDIQLLYAATQASGAACIGIPVVDSLRKVHDNHVASVVDRADMYAVSTPQGFLLDEILVAHQNRVGHVTDDAELIMATRSVNVVRHKWPNPKMTFPDDLRWGEAIAWQRLGLVKSTLEQEHWHLHGPTSSIDTPTADINETPADPAALLEVGPASQLTEPEA